MIRVTRLNGQPVVINSEQIKMVEQTPDTMITLLTGDRLMVKESVQEIVRRAIEYGRAMRVFGNQLPPGPEGHAQI